MKLATKKNKITTYLLLVIILIGQFPIRVVLGQDLKAANNQNWGNQFITNVKMTDGNGNSISSIPTDKSFKVRYEFAIPTAYEDDVTAGDKMEVQLPKELQTAQNDPLEFRDGNGNLVATGAATTKGGQQYVVTFTDYVETHSNVNGHFEFFVSFSSSVEPGEEINIEFETEGGTTIIPIKPEKPGSGGGSNPNPKPPYGNSSHKQAFYKGNGIIEWRVTFFPPLKSSDPVYPDFYEDMHNIRVYDELGPGLELTEADREAIIVRQAYGWKATITLGNDLGRIAKVESYDQSTGKFECSLPDITDGAGRQVRYSTRITDSEQVDFLNKASIEGTDYEKSTSQNIRIEGGTAGSEGEQAGFTVVKQDTDGNALAGAAFDLFRIASNGNETKIASDLKSDTNGRISYDKLKFGTYELRETQAPEGYNLLEEPYQFVLNSKGMKELSIPIINEREEDPVGSVELEKVDSENSNKTLSGAEFTLYKGKSSNPQGKVDTYKTDRDGQIRVDNLTYGDYHFVETKAPEGYELDATPINFKISDSDKVVKVEKENTRTPDPVGSVELEKVDSENNNTTLSGAEFTLYKGKSSNPQGKVDTYKTDRDGQIRVDNLTYGDYHFVETKAPEGYELDATPINFNISDSDKVVKVEKENTRTPDPVGSVELEKVDSENNNTTLSGAEFTLYRGKSNNSQGKVDTYKTDKDGQIRVDNLTYGDYHFVETKAPEGYELDATPINFNISDSDKVVKVEKENTRTPDPVGSVELEKVDSENNNTTLSGAEFTLYRGKSNNSQGKVDTYKTDRDGQIRVDNLTYGDYHFVETKAPEGYELDATPINFNISDSDKVVKVEKENTRTPDPVGSVELEKVDSENSNKTLSGAEFTLYKGKSSNPQGKVDTYKTDRDGQIRVDNLTYGDYHFVETKAPEGYELDATPINFKISDSDKVVKVEKENTRTPDPVGSVELEKVDSENSNKTLSGAEFTLYKGKSSNPQGKVDTYKTDRDGQIRVDNLTYGDYHFVETKAPEGYELDATPINFNIDDSDEVIELEKENTRIPDPVGSVQLKKVDYDHPNTALADAKFTLFRGKSSNPGEKIGTYTTNREGQLQVDDLTYGDYHFVETVAPSGYIKDSTPIDFTINDSDTMLELKKENHRDYNPQIETFAFEANTNDNQLLYPSQNVRISDRVTYEELTPGRSYRLEAKLLTKDGVSTISSGQKDFTAINSDGEEKVDLSTFDARTLRGQEVVVFEKLIDLSTNKVVATHEDLNDEDQTVEFTIPKGGVTFKKIDVDTKNVLPGAEFTLYEGKSNEARFALPTLQTPTLAPNYGGHIGFNTSNDIALNRAKALGVYTSQPGTGEVKVDGLPFGDYYFVETKAPTGYLITNGDPIDFEIVSDTTTLTLETVENKRDYKPAIETVAFETATNNKELYPGQAVKISDRVQYKELTPGQKYRLEAELVTKDEKVLTTGSKEFTVTKEDGEETVDLAAFDARDLQGQQVTVFEKLIDLSTNKVVATHVDINDADQTIKFVSPALETAAFETSSGEQEGLHPHEVVSISDKVDYTNLNPGEKYTLSAKLVDKATGKTELTQGKMTFTPEKSSGSVTVKLDDFNASNLKGQSTVVYEVLTDETGKTIAEHTDINSKTQTVSFVEPSIGTVARGKESGLGQVLPGPITIIDKVLYTNLDKTQTYDIEGILMDKATNEPLLVNGETVTATKQFRPEATNGNIEIEFKIDVSDLKGKDIVVFETLKLKDLVIAEHRDIKDKDQTIEVVDPKIGTTLTDKETQTQTPSPEEEITLADTVHYEHLVPGQEYTVKGILMDKETKEPLLIDGKKVEAETTFIAEKATGTVDVLFTFKAKDLAGKEVVAFENLYADGRELTTHTDINDPSQTVKFLTPKIGTSATGKNGDKELNGDRDLTVVDVVTYKDLIPGKEYTLKGKMMDKATGKPLIVKEKEVLGETTFTPEKANGTVEVLITFDASDLYGQELVVFEKLIRKGHEVVNHEDINDEGQTISIKVPEIKTELKDQETATQTPSPEEEITLVDTVRYENLTPGREYTVKGILMDKETKEPLLIDGKKVEAETTFIAEKATGTVDVLFTFKAKDLAGKEVVAFENLYADGRELTTHADIDDPSQTVKFLTPEIGTSATGKNGDKELNGDRDLTVVDVVTYKDLIPGKEYTLKGKMMDKATGKPLIVKEKEVLGETTFTPEKANGTVEVLITFDASDLYGQELVVFEKLIRKGHEVVNHEDINDEGQTISIKVPEIKTELKDQETETQTPSPEEEITLVDTVRYENLTPGREYTVKGILMDKATNEPLLIDDKKVEAETTFTAEKSTGEVEVLFTFKAKGLAGKEVVAFENLYADGRELTTHADIDDPSQTVKFLTPEIGTSATGKNGDKELNGDRDLTVVDVVTYKDLIPGKEYTLKGKMMDKATGEPLIVKDEEVLGETIFTPEKADGTVEVLFTFDASDLYGQELVVFEKLIRKGHEVVNHEDIKDKGQTISIKVPEIKTELKDQETETQTPSPEEEITLVDTVYYENLTPGREYTVKGILMDKATNEPLLIDDKKVEAETTFTAEKSTGEVEVLFTFKAKGLAGKEVVAFENLYADGRELTTHADIDDPSQTVKFLTPEIGTSATGKNGDKELNGDRDLTVVDVVTYKDLIPGKEYTLKGKMMDKATGEPLIVKDEEVLGETIFTPEKADGTVEVLFTFDASDLYGQELVVFEKLIRKGHEVVNHEDIKDKGQTISIKVPEIKTELKDQETETQTPSPEEEITLVDTVYYENLTPGREYTVKGILMDKETKEPLLIDGEKVEAETTFTAEKATGEVEVLFTFKAKDLAGKEVVAFENLYADGREVTTHADLNDPSQTVKFLIPKMKSLAADQAGNKDIMPEERNHLVDTIDCSDLVPGKEYTMDGTLMDKSTGQPLLVNGKEVHGKTTFTSKDSTEVVEVLFDLDARELEGKEVVIYEVLSRNGKTVITHEDIDDLDQTVKFVEVPTPETPDQPENKSGILPKTGYIYSIGGTILGVILLVLSTLFYLRKKRQNSM